MTKIFECDRCGIHTNTGYTLHYMVKDWWDDLGKMTFSDYRISLREFHLCVDCKDNFYDRDFPTILKKKKD